MNVQELINALYARPNSTKIQNELSEIEDLYREKGALAASVVTKFNSILERMTMTIVHNGEAYEATAACIEDINFQAIKRRLLLNIGERLP